nr:type II CAAX endopeptidase family protein [uncultured Niameybacter sp.]
MLENNKMLKEAKSGQTSSLAWIIFMPFLFTFLLSIGLGITFAIENILLKGNETTASLTYLQYIQYVVSFSLAGGGVLLVVRWVEKRKITSIGFFKERAISSYFKGVAIAVIGIMAIISILQFKGEVVLKVSVQQLGVNSLGLIILIGIAWIIQGAAEEILVRGYMFQSLSAKYGLYKGVLISSIVFALLHLGNNGITSLSLINILMCGLMLVLLVLKDENLWGACGFHTAWNLFQGNIFGMNVSGNGLDASLFTTTITQPSIWNGGQFGIEGSLLTTVFMLIISGILIWQIRQKSI